MKHSIKILAIPFLVSAFSQSVSANLPANISRTQLIQKAEQGNEDAQLMLAARYGKGYSDVPKDCSQSIYWFTRAAEQGSALGQFSLAMAYEQGDCVQQSHNQAVKWFKAAAQQNIPIAQAMLAQKYYRGQGVRQNRAKAKEWTGRACDNGIEDACHNYRLMNEGKY